MTWFKRWLCRGNSQLDNMASSIESLREIVLANENGFQKGFRRLSMAQKQQSEALELLVRESSALRKESSALVKEPSALGKEPSATAKELSAPDKEPSALNKEPSALNKEPSSLTFALAEHRGLTISYEQALHILDNLSKIELAANTISTDQDILAPLIARTTSDLLSLCEIEVTAKVGEPYPTQACEVVGAATEKTHYSPGTVTEILQQGYQTRQGNIVRNAKVIVAREPSSTTTKLEGTENAN